MSVNTQIRTRKAVKALWVIFDPLDGAHVFGSKAKAEKTLKRWEKEADGDPMDSVWDMTGPLKYSLDNAENDSRSAPCSLCEGMGELDGFGGGGRTDCHKCEGTGKENADSQPPMTTTERQKNK